MALKFAIFASMKAKKKKKSTKKRAKHYEPKLKLKGSFIDIINAAVTPKKKKKD